MQVIQLHPENNSNNLMSSKRIAEKTGKRHDNVIRDINKMLIELRTEDSSNLRDNEYQEVEDQRGYVSEIFLNERLCLCLASGYSIALRMAIIDDWAEMKQAKPALPELSRKELALMIVQAEEEKEQLQAQLKEAERTVAILTHVNKTYTATEVAKELGLKSAQELNKVLHKMGIQFKQGSTWVMYSKYADKGYTEIKQKVLDNGTIVYDRHFTQMGREFILNLLSNQSAA